MYLSDLVPSVTVQIPGCTDDVAMSALVAGAARFYRESTLWRESQKYTLRDGFDAIRLKTPDDTDIVAVKQVLFEGVSVDAVRASEISVYAGAPAAKPSVYVVALRDKLVRLVPAASYTQENAYDIECVLAPSKDADELLVDEFAAEFESAYVYAALAKLFAMPLFLNLQLASYNEILYSDMAQQAMNKAQGLLNGGVLSTTYGGL